MTIFASKLFYTKEDYALVALVEEVYTIKEENGTKDSIALNSYLHPNGIKQFFLPRESRIAHAIAKVLSGLQQTNYTERLQALASLQEECMYAVPIVCRDLRYNTARVLVKVMKELIKARGNLPKQLHLAHSFQRAARGNLYIVRKLLEEYHLLEMPEEYNQLSFDYHVHDMYSKGAKSPSQVLLDAWIQGVRTITVVYYNYVQPQAIKELMRAGEILNIRTHFGIEYHVPTQQGFAELVWSPLPYAKHLATIDSFLEREAVQEYMEEGKAVSNHIAKFTYLLLEEYNIKYRFDLEKEFVLTTDFIAQEDFIAFVGQGQASPHYLAEYIYTTILAKHATVLPIPIFPEQHSATKTEKIFSVEYILSLLQPTVSLGKCTSPFCVTTEEATRKHIYKLTQEFFNFAPSSFVCLNISKLSPEEVLTILWEGKGSITHLELFNLKDWLQNSQPYASAISTLQYAINTQDIQQMKQIVRLLIQSLAIEDIPNKTERLETLNTIFHDIPQILQSYRDRPLQVQLGSDSAGGINREYSIGFVFEETIPDTREKDPKQRFFAILPVYANITRCVYYTRKEDSKTFWDTRIGKKIHAIPLLHGLGRKEEHEWIVENNLYSIVPPIEGNIISTGRTTLIAEKNSQTYPNIYTDINLTLLCYLKLIMACVIAFITFKMSQEDEFLQYFGGIIWLGITVLRMVLQTIYAVGFERGSLVRIRDQLILSRIADLLIGTGIAVFIIEYLTRYLVLQKLLGITVATNPISVFVVMGITSVCVILSIGRIRGLPKKLVFASASRVFFSVPVALVYKVIIVAVLSYFGVQNIEALMESTASLIAKFAADSVVGVIIGILLRNTFVSVRLWDYTKTLESLFSYVNLLEERYPDKEITFLLQQPQTFIAIMSSEQKEIMQSIHINLLDLLYFWYYTPRSHKAFKTLVAKRRPADKKILLSLIQLLEYPEYIKELFTNETKPKNYDKFIEFYTKYHTDFVQNMKKLLS